MISKTVFTIGKGIVVSGCGSTASRYARTAFNKYVPKAASKAGKVLRKTGEVGAEVVAGGSATMASNKVIDTIHDKLKIEEKVKKVSNGMKTKKNEFDQRKRVKRYEKLEKKLQELEPEK